MKKSIVLATALVIIGAVLFWSGSAFAGPVARRQVRQQARIHRGMRSGAITMQEARILRREQRAIERARIRAWRDGRITHREQARLEYMQEKAGQHIYRAMHNRRVRRVWRDRPGVGPRPGYYRQPTHNGPYGPPGTARTWW